MNAGEHEFEELGELERELSLLRPARPSAGVEEVIALRLNEELEVAFVEALRGMALSRPTSVLEARLERDLAWEFRLEDRLRGLPLRSPTVALGRAVEVQVNLRALRPDEVVVPFPETQRDGELARVKVGRGPGWLVRWGVAAVLVVGGFGVGWKMAREAARELGVSAVAGRFESEAARATARMAVGAGWEPTGVPLPEGVGYDSSAMGSVGRLPNEHSSAGVSGGSGRAVRGADTSGRDGGDRRSVNSGVSRVGVGSDSRVAQRSADFVGDQVRGDGERVGGSEELPASLMVSGRLASRLASAQVPVAQGGVLSVGSEGGGKSLKSGALTTSAVTASSHRELVAGGAGPLALTTGALKLGASEVVGALGGAPFVGSTLNGRGAASEQSVEGRTGSRILDAVGGGDLARVIPVEILNAMESGAGLSEVRRLMDAKSLPVSASFSVGEMLSDSLGTEAISIHDLDGLGHQGSERGLGARTGLGGDLSDRDAGVGQVVYVAKDDELRLEVGKDGSGELVARFERLDGHFLAADTVRSAADLEAIANRAKGVLGYLPSLNGESVGIGPLPQVGPSAR